MKTDQQTRVQGRRFFVASAAMAGGALVFGKCNPWVDAQAARTLRRPAFPSRDAAWGKTWDSALSVLSGNIRTLERVDGPVLFEGSTYQGIWQECGPHESLVYASLREYLPARDVTAWDVTRNTHKAFFGLQLADGQLPAAIKTTGLGYGQIQMVVPIAATALEVANATGDEEFLAQAYSACRRWDTWLRNHRDTRKTGLVEGFCTYDTGHDNSPRWAGIPNRCPDADAKKCPAIASMPRLCPDLSATAYGGRIALSKMASALARESEADRWLADAEKIRRLIIDRLYSPQDASFYDVDAQDKFVRVRSDVISRALGEHVLDLSQRGDQAVFEAVWDRQLHNSRAFWAKFPLSSIAQDDPTFVRPIPRNSWGGASQALTALRAPRWMIHYGKSAELTQLMQAWCQAIMRDGQFRQQIDPATGESTQPDPGGYSPAALTFLDFARRLHPGRATAV